MKRFLSIILVIMLIFSTVGCSSQNNSGEDSTTSIEPSQTEEIQNTKENEGLNEISRELDCDIVVIGGGGSGLSAAASAARDGADVILLEKLFYLGGSLMGSEGIFAVESPLQKERGITYTTDKGYHELLNYHHYNNNARVVRAFVEASGPTIEWLMEIGAEFSDVALSQGVPDTYYWHIYKNGGQDFAKTIENAAVDAGVEILTETSGKSLIMDNGKVAGVMAEDKDGNKIKINSKAAIICTGGFGSNAEMLKKYVGIDASEYSMYGSSGHDGDGINMAFEVGAAEYGIEFIQSGAGMVKGEPFGSPLVDVCKQPYLWINSVGIRFISETSSAVPQLGGNAMRQQPGSFFYNVFDADTLKQIMETGYLQGRVMYPHSKDPEPKMLEILTEAATNGSGNVFIGETVEDLADKLGIESAALQATFDEYNELCEKGEDTWFAKDPNYLIPVKTGPFYAVKVGAEMLGTIGGIKINENAEVISIEEKVIPGLYAAGCDAGGLHGADYDFSMSGVTSGWAVVSGRIAAQNAVKYVK